MPKWGIPLLKAFPSKHVYSMLLIMVLYKLSKVGGGKSCAYMLARLDIPKDIEMDLSFTIKELTVFRLQEMPSDGLLIWKLATQFKHMTT